MRVLTLIVFQLTILFSLKAQQTETLDFAGTSIKPGENCEVYDYYHYKCADHEAKWSYYPEKLLRKAAFDITEEIKKENRKVKRQVIQCSLGGNDTDAYSLTYQNSENEKFYHLVVYGVYKGKGVVLEVKSQKPLENELPVIGSILAI